MRAKMTSSFERTPAVIAAAYACLFLPFIGKAFHIDDLGFLEMARTVDWNPFRATSASAHIFESTHTILLPYFIKFLSAMAGEREVPLHVAFLPFSALALACIGRLHARTTSADSGPVFPAVALFLSMPAFCVNAQTIMADVPSLAFLLAGMVFFVKAVEDGDDRAAAIAGLSFAVAALLAYQMLFAVPVAFFYGKIRKRMGFRQSTALALPLAAIGTWLLLVRVVHGAAPVAPSQFSAAGQGIGAEIARGLVPKIFIGKTVFILATFGASLLFAYAYRKIHLNEVARAVKSVSGMAAALFYPVFALSSLRFPEAIGLSLLLSLGVMILADIVRAAVAPEQDERRKGARLLHLSWVCAVMLYTVFLLPFGSARYVLPALPPALLLLLDVPRKEPGERGRGRAAAAVIAVAFLFGLAGAYADYRYADAYRVFSGEVERFSRQQPASTTVWFIGKWGMRYYLEKAGCRLLPPNSREPKKGDFIILAEMPQFWKPARQVRERMTFYASRVFRSRFPLRLFNGRSNAGFYAHHWGLLPFAFSLEPDEIFTLYEVVS